MGASPSSITVSGLDCLKDLGECRVVDKVTYFNSLCSKGTTTGVTFAAIFTAGISLSAGLPHHWFYVFTVQKADGSVTFVSVCFNDDNVIYIHERDTEEGAARAGVRTMSGEFAVPYWFEQADMHCSASELAAAIWDLPIGPYRLVGNNCQSFVRKLDRLLVHRRLAAVSHRVRKGTPC